MIKPKFKKIFTIALIVICAGFISIQFVPSSFSRINPPVTGEPQWDSPETRAQFFISCADCHSNQTTYPWYTTIAPVSWMIEDDVRKGRKKFNVSEWNISQRGGEDAAGEVNRGAMPVGPYLLMHPETNLNAKEKKQFVNGLIRTFGGDSEKED